MLNRLLVYFLLMLPGLAFGCGPYKVAFYDMGLLFARQPDGSWGGADKDVVDEIARRTGCLFEHRLEPRIRIWTMMINDKLDITVSGVATPEREAHATFLPYMGGRNLVLLRQDVDPAVKTIDDFTRARRYTVAIVKGFRHGPVLETWLERLRQEGRVYEATDVTATARLLQLGRVHAVIASNLQPEVNTPGLRAMDWAPQDNIVAGLALSKVRVKPADTARIAAALKAMRQDGTLEAIYRRRMGPALAAIQMQY